MRTTSIRCWEHDDAAGLGHGHWKSSQESDRISGEGPICDALGILTTFSHSYFPVTQTHFSMSRSLFGYQ